MKAIQCFEGDGVYQRYREVPDEGRGLARDLFGQDPWHACRCKIEPDFKRMLLRIADGEIPEAAIAVVLREEALRIRRAGNHLAGKTGQRTLAKNAQRWSYMLRRLAFLIGYPIE